MSSPSAGTRNDSTRKQNAPYFSDEGVPGSHSVWQEAHMPEEERTLRRVSEEMALKTGKRDMSTTQVGPAFFLQTSCIYQIGRRSKIKLASIPMVVVLFTGTVINLEAELACISGRQFDTIQSFPCLGLYGCWSTFSYQFVSVY